MSTGNYARINDLEMYYETQGKGHPLILLHGGLGSTGMFQPIMPGLAKENQVIAVDLQGNGRTADIDRPLSFELLADDIAALSKHLGLGEIDLMGYSLGGGVALQVVIRHPEVVRKLIVVSAPYKSDGWYPEVRTGMKAINAELAKSWIGSPMQKAYASIAPHPENWPTLAEKTGKMVSQEYDWSEAVPAIRAPVMIVIGDADSIRPASAVKFFELLGGGKADAGWDGSGMSKSRLAILPGMTHYNIFTSPALVSVVIAFLKEPMPEDGPVKVKNMLDNVSE